MQCIWNGKCRSFGNRVVSRQELGQGAWEPPKHRRCSGVKRLHDRKKSAGQTGVLRWDGAAGRDCWVLLWRPGWEAKKGDRVRGSPRDWGCT
jgi:hypothetical protein